MKRIIYILSFYVLFTSCKEDVLDINDNPNLASSGDLNLLLTGAQVAAGFWTSRDANEATMVVSNQIYQLTYGQYAIGPDDINDDWDGLYSSSLKEFQEVIVQGQAEELPGIVGIAQVYKAYLFGLMVDVWGDIPYFEALDGENNPTPNFDDGAEIYADLLLLIDEAKSNLQAGIDANEAGPAGDLVYNGDFASYIKVANTVKLRLLVNLRNVDENVSTSQINALIAEDNFIDENSENFSFQFGSNLAPLEQNPLYQQDYTGSGEGKSSFMNAYFAYKLLIKNDPRLNYYILKQATLDELTFDETPCNVRSDCQYWDLILAEILAGNPEADGLISRDKGNPEGIAQDGTKRATFGVYPFGGIYSDGSLPSANLSNGGSLGAGGAGITPWLTAANTHFLLAEAALMLPGVSGDARALLSEGIELSLNYVSDFSTAATSASGIVAPAISQADIDTYRNAILANFDNETGATGQLNVVIEEKFVAEYGNGWDSYTDFRRTGMPFDSPGSIVPLGPFPDRLPLSRSELTTNPNAPNPAPLVTEKVFWDVD